MSEVTLADPVLTGVSNDLQLEMKISKQEVVDMIVQEREDDLDEEIAIVNKLIAANQLKGTTLTEALNGAAKRIGETKVNAIVNALKLLYPGCGTRTNSTFILKKNSYWDSQKEVNLNHNVIGSVEAAALEAYGTLPEARYESGTDKFFDVNISVSLYQTDNMSGSAEAKLPVFESFRTELLATPEFKALSEFGTTGTELSARLNELRTSRQNLAATGKRAKAKLVRQMLESTPNGKAILNGVKGISKLGLLPAPKTI